MRLVESRVGAQIEHEARLLKGEIWLNSIRIGITAVSHESAGAGIGRVRDTFCRHYGPAPSSVAKRENKVQEESSEALASMLPPPRRCEHIEKVSSRTRKDSGWQKKLC